MATDIQKANVSNDISQGAGFVAYPKNMSQKKAARPDVFSPAIGDIESKYDARFDDPRYYSGDTPE